MANADTQEGAFQQATLITSVSNGILLFCGLLIAGILSLTASEAASRLHLWELFFALAGLILSLTAVVMSILATMKAHNYHRRTARAAAGETIDPKGIASARKLSVGLSLAGFWTAMAASVAVALLVYNILVFPEKPAPPTSARSSLVQVDKASQATSVSITDGGPVSMSLAGEGCSRLDTTSISVTLCPASSRIPASVPATRNGTGFNHAPKIRRRH